MNQFLVRALVKSGPILVLLFALPLFNVAQTTGPVGSLTNERVIQLVQSGVTESELLIIIDSAKAVSFRLDSADAYQLSRAGVSRATINMMSARQDRQVTPDGQGPAKVSATAYAPAPIAVSAVEPGSPRLGADRRLYISPMEGRLDGFIAAEIIKEHLPVHIVVDDNDVDLVLVGQSLKEDDHWYNAVWGGKDKNEGNLRLIDGRSRSLLWAGEAGDRSLIYGNLKRGGERKVAERLVRQMKKDYFRSTE